MHVITNFTFSVLFKKIANIWRVALIKAAPSEPPNISHILQKLSKYLWLSSCQIEFSISFQRWLRDIQVLKEDILAILMVLYLDLGKVADILFGLRDSLVFGMVCCYIWLNWKFIMQSV